MAPRLSKVHLDTAASGAGEGWAKDKDKDDSFDEHMVGRWMRWRASYPVRGTGGVILTGSAWPEPSQQQAWRHYVRRNKNGRVEREWWMPPYLVPLKIVSWALGGGAGDEILRQWAPSGGPATHQHYTNIHRIFCLAHSHPQVVFAEPHNLQRFQQTAWRMVTAGDNAGRANKTYESHHCDLHLVLGSGAEMIVGCSIRGARRDLLSLWWSPAAGCKMTAEMESLARAVFFDAV